jgi:hypothetical protein
MQEELTKHSRKIFQEMKNREHGMWEKVREIVIEILIIVFAVSLSIWLHNWSDHRVEQRQTDEFLAGIRVDLSKDITSLEENRQTFLEEDSLFTYLMLITSTGAVDTVSEHRINANFNYQMRSTHANIARYEGFKSNGKIGTIENDSLKQAILAYYQQTIPAVNDIEDIVNKLQDRLMDAQFTKDEKMSIRAFAKSFKARAYVEITVENLGPAIQTYADAEAKAKDIIHKIDSYLKAQE